MREFWSCSGWFIRPVVVSMLIFLSLFGVANLIQQNNRTYAANDLSITPATGYVGGGEPVTITLNQPLPYAKIIQTSAGREYSLGIDSNGQMYGWGQNGYGRIGTGNTTNLSVPTKIVNASNIQFKYVDATFDHSLGIDRDGNLYTWGENVVGKLGLGSINSNQYTPVKVTIAGDPKFILVDGGYDTSMALDDQGNVWTWGANNSYVLGHGDGQNKNVPTKVVNFSGPAPFFVTAVFSNDATELIFAIDTEGSIWGWGGNDGGSLGTGNTTTYPTPMKIYDAVTGNWFAGGAVSLPAGTKMAAVGASSVSGGAIDEHGNIYTWGSNNQRSMGSGSSAGGTGIPPLQIYTAATGDWLAAGSVDIGE
ncbi:hypothetical protein FWH58_03685, partial [Candidatus Saccharibacteria bacterium]|nr:hypothetical protein [Candidatus Saccharibacteria bacterium]